MAGRTVRTILLLVTLAASSLAAAGCRSLTNPFMGVPEWQTVRYGKDAPDPALEGVPRITAVEERDYAHYVRAASTGCLVAREVRGDWVYYAVATRYVVRVPGADPAAPHRAVAVVYERYRAKQPSDATPRLPPRMPVRDLERRDDAGIVPAGPDAEETRKRIEKDLKGRWKKQGESKIIRPDSAGSEE